MEVLCDAQIQSADLTDLGHTWKWQNVTAILNAKLLIIASLRLFRGLSSFSYLGCEDALARATNFREHFAVAGDACG